PPVPGSGNQEFMISFPAQFVTGRYAMQLGPDIRDMAGNAMDQDLDRVPGQVGDQFILTFGVSGPMAVFIDPGRVGFVSVDHINVRFNRPMKAETFDVSDVVVTGPSGPVPVTEVRPTPGDPRSFDILLAAPQTTLGFYTLRIASDVRDTWDNPLDSNGNLIAGEPFEDNVVNTFRILPRGCFDYDAFGYTSCFDDWQA